MTKKKDNEVKNWNDYYDEDDFSEIILSEIVRSKLVYDDAKNRKLTPEDFVSGLTGTRVYSHIAQIINDLDVCPIDRALFNLHFSIANKDKKFDNYEGVDEFIDQLFDPARPSQEDYVLKHLGAFMRRRRMLKASLQHKDDIERQRVEYSKIDDEMQAGDVSRKEESLTPFEQCVKSEKISGIVTGIPIIDQKTGGLGKGECGLIIGHSGSGKTAVASYIAREAAIAGFNTLYISAEEPMQNIIHRWYAQQFGISYTEMHKGNAEVEKQGAFQEMSAETREKLMHLRISDVRALAPLNTDQIKKVIDEKADDGFIPDVVIIDQMDYLRPKRDFPKGSGKWQEYEAVAFECDLLSQYKIGGVENFALWVVHQAVGDMQWTFTYNDIAGFKGIVKPFDMAIGVGREDRESTHVNLFSLKVRHTEHFRSPQRADFKFMRFYDDPAYKPKFEREAEAKRALKAKGKVGRPRKNPVAEEVEA